MRHEGCAKGLAVDPSGQAAIGDEEEQLLGISVGASCTGNLE